MVGKPIILESNRNNDTDPTDSETIYAFMMDIQDIVDAKDLGFSAQFDSFAISIDDFIMLVLNDALKAVLSMAFVFMYLNFHLQSCTLGVLGMGIIVLSFPATVIVTNGIL